jgi:hypothetical protein
VQTLQFANFGIQSGLAGDNRGGKPFATTAKLPELACQSAGPGLEFSRRLLQPLHVDFQCGRALDQRCVGGARLRGPPVQLICSLTSFEEPSLRRAEAIVGNALILLQPND